MPRARAFLLPVVAVALCGCRGEAETARARDGRATVVLDDFRLVPQRISARARGGPLTFTIRNDGRLAHTWTLRGLGGTRLKISSLLPGEQTVKVGRVPKGDYRMFCRLANHEELGMYGTLVVR